MAMGMVGHAVKARRFTGLCAALLALGLCLFLFVHPATQHALDVLHGTVGMCLGMSAAFGAGAIMLRVRGDCRD